MLDTKMLLYFCEESIVALKSPLTQSVLKFGLKTSLKHYLQSVSKQHRNGFEFKLYRVSQNEMEMASNPV